MNEEQVMFIEQAIRSGKYDALEKSFVALNSTEITQIIHRIAFDYTDINAYGFARYYYYSLKEEIWLDTIISVMGVALCHLSGAYAISLHYCREGLAGNDALERRVGLLFYYECPDAYIDKQEVDEIINDALKCCPERYQYLTHLRSIDKPVPNSKYLELLNGKYDNPMLEVQASNDLLKTYILQAIKGNGLLFYDFFYSIYASNSNSFYLKLAIQILIKTCNNLAGTYYMVHQNIRDYVGDDMYLCRLKKLLCNIEKNTEEIQRYTDNSLDDLLCSLC